VKQLSHFMQNQIFIGVGTNIPGAWGTQRETIARCLNELETLGFSRLRTSSAYRTRPVGVHAQPDFTNLVLELDCDILPRDIIRSFKRLEHLAGRRSGPRNGPRPLDLDLLAYRDWVVNWPTPRHRPKIVLPHPFVAERAFVLVPLAEIASGWRHPVTGQTARQMLLQLGGAAHLERTGQIERLDYVPDL
jgi:2-amino-4-hydroxy-6-hydroxymethyldihydropteridine diphosphokinase